MSMDLVAIKNALAGIDMGLDDDTRAVAGGGGGNNKRISIEGGVFRKYSGGKEVAAIEDRFMNVIFVKMNHAPSRTYYKDTYVKGAKVSPACWSSNSKAPDADVTTPMSSSCDTCPMSVKGSSSSGQGAACRMSWRTAVVLPSDPKGDVMQLVIPSASIWGDEDAGRWPFKAYVRMLAGNNISANRVVTKMQFDTKSSSPKLLFSPAAAVDAIQIPSLIDQSKSSAAESAVKFTVFKQEVKSTEVPAAVLLAAKIQAEEDTDVAEPVLRKPDAVAAAPEKPVGEETAAIINRWVSK